jgi:DNA-binding MarR family transcriptional regulator
MSMSTHDRVVDWFRFRLATLLALKYGLGWLSVWAFLWGIAVLVLRTAAGTPRPPLLWGLAGLPLVLLPALVMALRRLPPRTVMRAVLDHQSHSGGLLMAGAETDIGHWQETLPAITTPQIRWHGGRSWGLFALAASFVLLSFLVPQWFVNLAAANPLEVGDEVEKLANQIEVLKEEAILVPERAESLQEKLSQVREEASGQDPVKTLEALDHLQDVTSKAAKEAAESALQKTEQLAQAETLAAALQEAGATLDAKVQTEAMTDLAALLQKAAAETDLARHLDPEAMKACKAGSLNPEQLKQIAAALRGSKQDLSKVLDKLHKAGLIDLETLKQCEACGQCNGAALAALLKECQGNQSVAECLAQCNNPGRGGVTRGRGDAPLTWGEKTSEEGVKFKEETLPPAALAALKESQLAGVSQGAPQVEKGGGPSRPGALQGAAAGGGSANTQLILPRHRGTVERYFERPARPSK